MLRQRKRKSKKHLLLVAWFPSKNYTPIVRRLLSLQLGRVFQAVAPLLLCLFLKEVEESGSGR